ncbi:inositol monophosphatase family protein [Alicyclobacillus shizuokensis]|uniref:inositol monophosphatase family protein n=1 Tax=Alicyclobacillus shizuokensis TaxID=392014 RepID=UPI0008326C6B|nr:inositol monophosphatase family protein [Alicyclobacillus shizuokensis]MCL6627121.1 inositol monophosphatase [Alicyclobacillus shizuokensis]
MAHSAEQARLAVAVAAALEAGRYFSSRLYNDKQVKSKSSPSDLVTDVDPKCEDIIRRHIRSSFADDAILGEETTEPGSDAARAAASQAVDQERVWVVDPLDGTTNFVQQIPLSAVSIAYAERGLPIVGVVFDPYRSEVFLGLRGQGAYLCSAEAAEAWMGRPDEPLPGVRLSASAQETVARSVIATGFPSRHPVRESRAAALAIASQVKSLRVLGTAAIEMAYVAAGRLDAYWEYDLNAWDLAAGALLVTEAGGIVLDVEEHPYDLTLRNVVAAGRESLARALCARIQHAARTGDE